MNDKKIILSCPHCEKKFEVTTNDIGKEVICDCGSSWIWSIKMEEFVGN